MITAALVLADTEGLDTSVRGEPLLAHCVRGVAEAGCAGQLVVLAPERRVVTFEKILQAVPGTGQRCRVLPCSPHRAESIRSALDSLTGPAPDVVLLCEAARAFVPPPVIRAVAETVFAGAPAAVPVLPVTDTVKLVDSRDVIIATEDRARLRTVQGPLGCTPEVLREACERGVDPVSEPPGTVRTIAGHQNALRLATPFDVAVAEALLSEEQA
ncbi:MULTISPECIES: IspD/TarI family cytidylyltransferase [Amycolatopsis]|uniref:2-C-methyl-D-erythritol 4-phosphate cytidylyltransferase n=2 Tax=Amycolatopsis TaxID=1813 RepID=A0A1I4AUM4_9PSEU|nr:2-C-methyl-D-erythritol 4-phosphate cytidylyltransferase [Amycolatopsis sacchari]SFK60013.1 2-C-methyl-D-erythritol 4-phosphate cytidylyltransferase [Amycolatopsis sacchari]